MDEFNDAEVRVLGSLVEKSVTTPDHYPLSLNALVTACNQRSNREPVVNYTEEQVVLALDSLRERHLAWECAGASARVRKYSHQMAETLDLSPAETAVLCLLMLRGPQTVGELKGRTARLHAFADLAEVAATLESLANRESDPLTRMLPRQAGRRESRYCHLLSGEPALPAADELPVAPPEPARVAVEQAEQAHRELTAEVAALRAELDALRAEFDTFRSQFD
jgi:uncharacterized protein YceH (UPF0502 family)